MLKTVVVPEYEKKIQELELKLRRLEMRQVFPIYEKLVEILFSGQRAIDKVHNMQKLVKNATELRKLGFSVK